MEGQLPDVAPRRDPIDPVESEFAVACAVAAAVSRVRLARRLWCLAFAAPTSSLCKKAALTRRQGRHGSCTTRKRAGKPVKLRPEARHAR